jgi:hypothetical protein
MEQKTATATERRGNFVLSLATACVVIDIIEAGVIKGAED